MFGQKSARIQQVYQKVENLLTDMAPKGVV